MGSSNTELNSDSSPTISDGSTTKVASDSKTETETETANENDEVSPSPYEVGEKVLAYHSQQIYEAKVIIADYQSKEWQYYVHYPGWNKNWDEWVGVNRLMKYNDENVQKFLVTKQGQEKNTKAGRGSHIKPKSSSAARGRKRKSDSLSKEKGILSLEKLVNLQIPPTLKKQLLDDCQFITHLGKLVKLPRTPNVDDIMKKYLDYRLKKDGLISEAVGEIIKGLCWYFNKALVVMLLYKSEREQYTDAIKDDVSPSTVYGAEHLLRLFVKLPELLIYANIEDETLMELQQDMLAYEQRVVEWEVRLGPCFYRKIRALFSSLLTMYWKTLKQAPTDKMIRMGM
ncbi:chromatin binding protein, putative [Ricinus communis]|uniref:Chromatin binding protein, putative n=1 Tax=Ricinus communis TaxID=3988 RepID=B9R754_RICCO|nr:chromatin binding protein, putative [Ricinus communis]